MIDMHVHILPGVDDGATDAQMTQAMMRRAADAGITMMFATPHVYRAQERHAGYSVLRTARNIAHEEGIALNLGCEFNYRALQEHGVGQMDDYCLGMTKCLLLELSNTHLLANWEQVISALMDNGYLPIIAHPERYGYIQRDLEIAHAMIQLGCEMQVDACGLMAPLMSAERRTARKLLKEGLVSYIASDAHRPQDYDDFEKAYRIFHGEWPRENRLNDLLRRRRKERTHDVP